MKIVIVIPTYNEAENIEPFIEALLESTKKFPQHTTHLLVVDDNSPDGTGEIVKKLKSKHKGISLLTGEKHGLGQAYLRGFRHAIDELGADVLFEIDADFQHDPHSIGQFVEKIDEGYDFVIGSRYIAGGSIPRNWGIRRKILSLVGNVLVRAGLLTFSIRDWTSGYRAIKSWVYKGAEKKLADFNGYTFQVAFLHEAKKSKAKIVEIPIHFGERKYGKSKIGSEYVKNLLLYLGKTRFKESLTPRFLKFLVVGTIGFIINTVTLELLVRTGVRPSIAGGTGAELAIISNFTLNNLWTFKEKKITSVKQIPVKFLIFNAASFGSVIIQATTIEIGTSIFGTPTYRIFYVLGVGIGLIWNYIMYNRVVWQTHKK
jgi:dolichol-phosphate mannosyltransferase